MRDFSDEMIMKKGSRRFAKLNIVTAQTFWDEGQRAMYIKCTVQKYTFTGALMILNIVRVWTAPPSPPPCSEQ